MVRKIGIRCGEGARPSPGVFFQILGIVLAVGLQPLPGVASPGVWESIGPQGSTPKAFLLPPSTSVHEQYTATMRALFGRTPEGEWIPISPDYGGFSTWVIDDIAVAPSDPDRIYLLRTGPYAGTRILRTRDGGHSWDEVSLPVPINEHFVYTLAIHPDHADTLLAGSFGAVWRSVDAGETWEEIGGSLPDDPIPTDIVIRPDKPDIVLMGCRGDDPGIFRSPDLGDTWERVFDGVQIVQLVLSPEDPRVGYGRSESLTGVSRIYRSTNGGRAWSLWSEDPRLATDLRIDPGDPLRMYILGDTGGGSRDAVMESVDGGRDWSVITTTGDVEASSFVGLGIAPGSGGDPAVLYLGTNFWGVYRSTDDGGSWMSDRLFAAYMGSIAHDPWTPGRVYMGTSAAMNQSLANGRLHVSEDYGASWSYIGESVTPGQPVGRVLAIEPSHHVPDRVWVGTSYGLFFSDDAGHTLSHSRNGLVRSIREDPVDPDHVFFGTASAPAIPVTPPRLLETTDGGASWVEIGRFDQAVLCIELDDRDGRVYCALGAVSPSGLSIPGAGGLFWRDEGSEWSEATDLSGLHVSGLVIDPDDPDRLYASTLGDGVFASTDRGLSWTPLNEGLVDDDVHALTGVAGSGGGIGLVAGTWSGSFRWIRDRWESLSEGIITFPSGGDSLALQTTVLDSDPMSGRLYVGSSGRSAYAIDIEPPSGVADGGRGTTGLPKGTALYPNFPNPFNPSTTIPFDLPGDRDRRQPVTLSIYDLRGRRVRVMIDSSLGPGRHQVVWDGRDRRGERVPSGIYLYALKAGGERFVRKLTLLE